MMLWAVADNAPEPASARKTPASTVKTPIETRRLKKADCDAEVFFMGGVEGLGVAETCRLSVQFLFKEECLRC